MQNEKEKRNAQPLLVCSECGAAIPANEAREVDGQIYCKSCYDDVIFTCDCCGRQFHQDDGFFANDISLCSHCYDSYYTHCAHCDALIGRSEAYYYDGNPYCHDCYEEVNYPHNSIHDYYFKPEPIFKGEGSRYFGVELEVDEGGESHENALHILEMANPSREALIYAKHDGSLEDGFEIVSHPMTLDFHKTVMPWGDVMKELINMYYTSHKAGTCGLHVHVNRTSLGGTQEERDAAIGRILYFVESHWTETLRFSRRTEAQMQRWAARYGNKNSPKEMIDEIKKTGYSDRYKCINLTNSQTVEFRMFRGTLKLNTFIATLEFVNELCDAAVALTDDEMAALSWSDFVKRLDSKRHKELIAYLKERRLMKESGVTA